MRQNILWLVELRKKGTLKYWATYLRVLKFCKGSGYLPKSGTRSLGKYSTFMNHLKHLIRLGWAWKTKNGYRLTSHIKLGLNRILITGDSTKELIARCAACALDQSIIKQVYKTAQPAERKRLLKQKRNGSATNSVRWFSKLMGYASPASGVRIERLMEECNIVEIKRNSQLIGHVDDPATWRYLKLMDLNYRFFIKQGHAYERLTNTLILL